VQDRAYDKVSQQLDHRREQRGVLLRGLEFALGDTQDDQDANQEALVLSCTHQLIQQLQTDAKAAIMKRRELRLFLSLDSSLKRGRDLRDDSQRLQGSTLRDQQAIRRSLLALFRHRTKKEDDNLLPRANEARKILSLIRLQHLFRALTRLDLHNLRTQKMVDFCSHDLLAQLRRLVHGYLEDVLSARALSDEGLNQLSQARSLTVGQIRGPARTMYPEANLDMIVDVNSVSDSSIGLRTKSVHLRVNDRQPRLRGLHGRNGRIAHLEEAEILS
jgi:hypothetical protein